MADLKILLLIKGYSLNIINIDYINLMLIQPKNNNDKIYKSIENNQLAFQIKDKKIFNLINLFYPKLLNF